MSGLVGVLPSECTSKVRTLLLRDDFNAFIQKNWTGKWWKHLLQHLVTQAERDMFTYHTKKERLYMYDLTSQFQQEPAIRSQMNQWNKASSEQDLILVFACQACQPCL